jgi:hypothetical protein
MKISVEFDTETKKGHVAMDGVKLENVSSVNMYGWDEDNFSVEVKTSEQSEDKSYTKITSVYASEAGLITKETTEQAMLLESIGRLVSNSL